jgi:hypothetical protein
VGQLPGGSGNGPPILAQLGGHGTFDIRHASGVSCSELSGGCERVLATDGIVPGDLLLEACDEPIDPLSISQVEQGGSGVRASQ